MKQLVGLIALFSFTLVSAQNGGNQLKGATPLAKEQIFKRVVTYAVVVGISDYQDPAIPDLRFADKDAEAFVRWLQSPAGGNISKDNITLLTNQNGTGAKFAMALDGLIDNCKPGNQAIIYFSGHGDVERKILNQPGYLLCHDAPANVYYAGGTLNLLILQGVITTLSQNNVRVIVITDACHSGNLAGNPIHGTQVTAQNLQTQFANEVKIMSCQPNELSEEGEQWGGGRGVFSYHLLEGLTGLADKNSDSIVSLFEIQRFLEDVVPPDVKPDSQIPQVSGDKNTILSHVDPSSLALLRLEKDKIGNQVNFTNPVIHENEVLASVDFNEKKQYLSFKSALLKGNLIEPKDSSADFFFSKLIKVEKFKDLIGFMTREFAAALIDEVQQAINSFLNNDPYEATNWRYYPEKYSKYPDYLQKAIDLLGESHYLFPSLMAKKLYFEAYNISKTLSQFEHQPLVRDSLQQLAKQKYLKGINFEPEAAYIYYAIGNLYSLNINYLTDSVVFWCSRAIDRSPSWIVPMIEISEEYLRIQSDNGKASIWLQRALDIQPNSYLLNSKLAYLLISQGKREDARLICQKLIREKPDIFEGYFWMGIILYHMDGDYQEAIKQFSKAIELNPSIENFANHYLGACYLRTRKINKAIKQLELAAKTLEGLAPIFLVEAFVLNKAYDKAEFWAKKVMDENLLSFGKVGTAMEMGKMYLKQNQYSEAEKQFKASLAADVTPDEFFILDYAWLGELARLQNNPSQAEAYFKKALEYGGNEIARFDFKEEALYLYGNFLLRQNKNKQAIDCFQKAAGLLKKGHWGNYGMALFNAKDNNTAVALDWLEKSLDNYYPEPDSILTEPLFKEISKTKRFQELMNKYFPVDWRKE